MNAPIKKQITGKEISHYEKFRKNIKNATGIANLKRYLPKYLKDNCTSPSSCKPEKFLTKFLVFSWVNALSRKMTLTVAFKTTTELNFITVVKPVYMTLYYEPGNGVITNEKKERKLPKVKWDGGVLLLLVESIRLNEFLHIQCNEIKQNTQYIF